MMDADMEETRRLAVQVLENIRSRRPLVLSLTNSVV